MCALSEPPRTLREGVAGKDGKQPHLRELHLLPCNLEEDGTMAKAEGNGMEEAEEAEEASYASNLGCSCESSQAEVECGKAKH